MWHSARASTGSDRSRLHPPSEVSVASEREQPAVGVEADLRHVGVEAVPLAGHRHVLGAVEPQPDRTTGERRAEGGDRGIPVRLHLLAAEAAAHPQALDRDSWLGAAEDVGDDLLGLRGVLRAALDEDLAVLVDQRQGAVGLEVEVLLARELELTAEDVRAPSPARSPLSPRSTVRLRTLEAPASIASGHVMTARAAAR